MIEKCRGCGTGADTIDGLDVEGLGRMHYSCEVRRLNNLIEEMQPDPAAKAGPSPEREAPAPEYFYHYSGAYNSKGERNIISGVMTTDKKVVDYHVYEDFIKGVMADREIEIGTVLAITSLTLLSERN
jgi:hypothetical protein